MVLLFEILLTILYFLLGAVIGSFLNVLIYRLPLGLNPAKGFSFCPICKNRLYPKDLIPILSWLILRGRCRYCGAGISMRYLLVEAVTGIAFAAALSCATVFGLYSVGKGIILCLLFAVLLTITLIDADTRIIPDSMNISVAVIGLLSIRLMPVADTLSADLIGRLIGIFCISLPLFIITLIIDGAFGGGDIKLMAAAGLLLGWKCTLVAFFIGVIIGGIYATFLLAGRKRSRKEHFAFGPSLCIGIMVSAVAGEKLISMYLSFF